MEQRYGPLVLARIGAIVKVKNERLKLRLIHDLRRSGSNAKATVPERIILPRIIDAVFSMLDVARAANAANEEVEAAVLDYKNAFKHVPIHPSERRFFAGQAEINGQSGFFVYCVLMFDAVTGLLLWDSLCAS